MYPCAVPSDAENLIDDLINKSSRPDCVRKWIVSMMRARHTLIILNNFLRELCFNNLDRSILEIFLDRLGEKVEKKGIPPLPQDMIEQVVNDIKPTLHVKGVIDCPRAERYSTIKSVAAVIRHIKSIPVPLGDDQTEKNFLDQIEAGLIRGEDLRLTLKGRHDFCWVTPSQDVEETIQHVKLNVAANRLRNRLGKMSWGIGTHLLEIKYPEDFFTSNNLRLAVPTVLDAGSDFIFRPETAEDGWGRTVDLDDLGHGVREGVHKKVDTEPGFELTGIGVVTDNIPYFDVENVLEKSKQDIQ